MSDYAWFPVFGMPPAGQTITADNTLTWDNGTFTWNTPSFWANASEFSFTGVAPPIGVTPGNGDGVGLIAGTVNPGDLATYNEFAPILNDPQIVESEMSTTVLLNSGAIDLAGFAMGGFGIDEPAIYPTLIVDGADFIVSGSIVNSVTAVFGYPIGEQSANGGGTIDIEGGGTVEAGATVQSDIDLNFSDSSNDIVKLDAVSVADTIAFSGSVTNFGAGDTIWLPNVPASLDGVTTTATYDTTTDSVTLSVGDPTTITIDLSGPDLTSATSVLVQSNSLGGIDLITCFAAGTHIATPRGELPVEQLAVGDTVEVVLGGQAKPIVWVGRRTVDCRRHPRPAQVWPVRVSAHAFGPGAPARDLFLSPNHAIYLENVLIPVKRLINGTSIAQVPMDEVTYYHVELAEHDILLTEGLPTESYLNVQDQSDFANGSDAVRLHPDFSALLWEALGCAPLVVSGPELAAARQRVNANAERGVHPVADAAA